MCANRLASRSLVIGATATLAAAFLASSFLTHSAAAKEPAPQRSRR